jgi:hypothetical protein
MGHPAGDRLSWLGQVRLGGVQIRAFLLQPRRPGVVEAPVLLRLGGGRCFLDGAAYIDRFAWLQVRCRCGVAGHRGYDQQRRRSIRPDPEDMTGDLLHDSYSAGLQRFAFKLALVGRDECGCAVSASFSGCSGSIRWAVGGAGVSTIDGCDGSSYPTVVTPDVNASGALLRDRPPGSPPPAAVGTPSPACEPDECANQNDEPHPQPPPPAICGSVPIRAARLQVFKSLLISIVSARQSPTSHRGPKSDSRDRALQRNSVVKLRFLKKWCATENPLWPRANLWLQNRCGTFLRRCRGIG